MYLQNETLMSVTASIFVEFENLTQKLSGKRKLDVTLIISETEQNPVASPLPVQKPFHVPVFLIIEKLKYPRPIEDNRVTESSSIWWTFLSCFTDTKTATRRKSLTVRWPDCSHGTNCPILNSSKSTVTYSFKNCPRENEINTIAHNNLHLCAYQNNCNLLCSYM